MTSTLASATSPCPVCGTDNPRVYLEGESEALDASMLGSNRKTISPGRILRCRTCDFGFRQTRFDARQLAELYRAMDARVYQAQLTGRRKTAARHLRIVQQYRRAGRILDVGCASGLFLTLAMAAGFDPTGVEPSDVLRSQAQAALGENGRVLRGTLEQAPLAAACFDAITLWDVLEHVPDPLAMLLKCRDLLKPDGYLFLNVPDLGSLEARFLGRRWPLLLAEHLNYFNRSSLEFSGKKAGLKLVRFGRRRAFFSWNTCSTGFLSTQSPEPDWRTGWHKRAGEAADSRLPRGDLRDMEGWQPLISPTVPDVALDLNRTSHFPPATVMLWPSLSRNSCATLRFAPAWPRPEPNEWSKKQ
jgi:SAM-dependent methyltransferase